MREFLRRLTVTMVAVLSFSGMVSAQSVTQTADLNVTGVGVTETTAESITLVWDENPNAVSYTVEFGTDSVLEQGDTYNMPPQETETNQITISELTPDTIYYFSVVAYGEDKLTASLEYSQEVSVATASSNEVEEAMTGLKVDTVKAINLNGMNVVELDFNSDMELDENDISSFTIVRSNDPNQFLEIKEIKANNQDNSKFLLVTGEQEVVEYSLIMTALQSVDKQTMSEDNAIVEFTGVAKIQDNNTAEETTLSGLKIELLENSVKLSWDIPAEEDNVSEIRIYHSTDNGSSFTAVKSNVDPNTGSVTLSDLKTGIDNQLKVALVIEGNETQGQTIEFELAETGPASTLFAILIFSTGLAYYLRRKNQFALEGHF